ncbi:hypothetical protein [Chamaesiphon minutus]|uniref:hypothetical protein n=1 Tax=Chamaesiphon minutus TaxID=1173032 RepID=UPI00030FBE25|nr:hypothetical protein [Chamaesiphon minutus]
MARSSQSERLLLSIDDYLSRRMMVDLYSSQREFLYCQIDPRSRSFVKPIGVV